MVLSDIMDDPDTVTMYNSRSYNTLDKDARRIALELKPYAKYSYI